MMRVPEHEREHDLMMRQDEGGEVPTPPDEPAEPPVKEPPDTPVTDPAGPVREPGTGVPKRVLA